MLYYQKPRQVVSKFVFILLAATVLCADIARADTLFDSNASASHWPGSAPSELGMRFRTLVDGTITGVRFFKANNDTGSHIGTLWSGSGVQLATVTFSNESATGWQEASFASAVSVSANTEYVISYHSSSGRYAYSGQPSLPYVNGFITGIKGLSLTFVNTPTFPTNNSSNHLVDVVFSPNAISGSGDTSNAITVFDASLTPQFHWPGSTPTELGLKFKSSEAGNVLGVRFYKGNDDTGGHLASLWDMSGNQLANVPFVNESGTGWQETLFLNPVPIQANIEYVVSYNSASGRYAYRMNPSYPFNNSSLTGLKGHKSDGTTSTFPASASGFIYMVDVLFEAGSGGGSQNSLPTAAFSTSSTQGDTPFSVSFDASASSDSDGSIVSYDWDYGDSSSGQGVQTSHIYTQVGTFTTSLTVTDDQGGVATEQVQIIVEDPTPEPNADPIASFTASAQSGTVSFPVTFNATTSTDTDGTIASYHWDFGDGSTGTSKLTSHIYSNPGEHTVTLTVTDDDQATATHQLIISANAKPEAVMSLTPTSGDAPLTVQFDATGSTDQDGTISAYIWDFGDGTSGQGMNTSHVYTAEGSYFPKLTVVDDDGAQDLATASLIVNPSNQPPIAQFTATPSSGNAPLTVQFDANGASDSDGTIDSYSWNFGDGSAGQGVSTSHIYSMPGSYLAELTLTDDDGASHVSNHQIQVTLAPPLITTPSGSTSNENITLSGSSFPNSNVFFYVDSVASVSTTADEEGIYSVALTLTEGEHNIHSTAELNGSVSGASNSITVTYSEIQPITPPASNIDPSNDALTGEVYKGKLGGIHNVEKDGSFSYQIPIEVAPGINGMQPDLALTYNSNKKNGLLGIGWSLSGLSSIQRCPASHIRDGYVSGINSGDEYKYCLDGQRLIEVSANNFRTEVEQFIKIEMLGSHWVVTHQDGSTSRYGYSANSRWKDSDHNPFIWYLDERRDISGNYLSVVYEHEAGGGGNFIDPWSVMRPIRVDYTKNDVVGGLNQTVELIYENRTQDFLTGYIAGQNTLEWKRLSKIKIVSNSQQVRSYLINYQSPDTIYNGAIYDDPIEVSRIASVTLCYDTDFNCAKPTEFEWEVASSEINVGTSNYLDIPNDVHFADFDGDGKTDALSIGFSAGVIPEGQLRIVYGSQVITNDSDAISIHEGLVNELFSGSYTVLADEASVSVPYERCENGTCVSETFSSRKSVGIIDFNADGLMDYFIKDEFNAESMRVFIASESRQFTQSSDYTIDKSLLSWNGVFEELVTANGSYEFNRPYSIMFRDFNGDGLVDALRYKNITHYRPDGSVSSTAELVPGNCYLSNNTYHCVTIPESESFDCYMNEDIYECVAITGNNTFDIQVALNNGSGFGAFSSWGSGAYLPRQIADVNGDRLLDLVGSIDDANVIRGIAINKGDHFEYNDQEWGLKTNATSQFAEHNRDRLIGDFNGDGLTDFLSFPGGLIHIHHSKGTGISEYSIKTGVPMYRQLTGAHGDICWWSVVDLNADKKSDLVDSCSREVLFSYGNQFLPKKAVFGDPQTFEAERIQYSLAHPQAIPPSFPGGVSDINHDGKVDYLGINTLSYHRLLGVDAAGENKIRVNYAFFGQNAQYQAESQGFYSNNFVNSITTAGASGGEMVSTSFLDSVFDQRKGQFGVATLSVSNGIGGWLKTEYLYRGAKDHLAGYGNLGFSEVTETSILETSSESVVYRKKINEFSQLVSSEYNLAGTALKATTYIANSQGNLTKTLETSNQWQVRAYNDDIDSGFDSPHYHPYQVYSNTLTFDLETGLQTGTEINKFGSNTNDQTSCEPSVSYPDVVTTDDAFYPQGLAKEIVKIKCNAFGVSGSVTRNLEIEPFHAYGLPKKRVTDYWSPKNGGSVDTRSQVVDYTYNTLGQVTSETIEADSGDDISITTSYQYNNYGTTSVVSESWVNTPNNGLDFTSRSRSTTENYLGTYRELIDTNELGQTEIQWFDLTHGNNIRSVNRNNQETTRQFDAFGRLVSETEPNNVITQYDYQTCNYCLALNLNAVKFSQTKKSGEAAVRTYLDSLDRQVVKQTKGLNGDFNYTLTEYDELSRILRNTDPFRVGDIQQSTWFEYDFVDRTISTTYPDKSVQTMAYYATQQTGAYGYATITSTDSLGRSQNKVVDTDEKTRLIVDALGTPIYYFYDPLENLTEVELEGHKQIIVYDKRSRKVQLDDPDIGIVNYKYNPLGLLAEETNASGEVTRYEYDQLGRTVKRIDDVTGTPLTHTFTYDPVNGIGLPSGTIGSDTDGNPYSKYYTYNSLGLMSGLNISIAGANYSNAYYYDDFNRLSSRTWPTGFMTQNQFSVYSGQVAQIDNITDGKIIWHAINDDARGNLVEVSLGNGLLEESHYFPETGLVNFVKATGNGFVALDQKYTWDAEGNLTSRSDHRTSTEINQQFCYDSLNRLKIVSSGSCLNTDDNGTAVDFSYDLKGNLVNKQGMAYSYGGGLVRPHAVTQAGGNSYGYDSSGRMISGNNRTIGYTSFGKPNHITKGGNTVHLAYGSDKSRISRTDTISGTSKVTVYVDGDYEKVSEGSETKHLHYLNTPDGNIGLYIKKEVSGVASHKTMYHHRDHLGSLVSKTDDQGNLVQSTEFLAYDPWGKRLNDNWDGSASGENFQTEGNQRGYTDHEHLDGVGLIHMNGRVYDPDLARFISPDPWIQDPYNTQSFNRYSYVWNNPMRYTDPTGEFIPLVIGAAKVVAWGITAYSAYETVSIASDVVSGKKDISSPEVKSEVAGAAIGLVAGPAFKAAEKVVPDAVKDKLASSVAKTFDKFDQATVAVSKKPEINSTPYQKNIASSKVEKKSHNRSPEPEKTSVESKVDTSKVEKDKVETGTRKKTYQTYTKVNPDTGEVYTGRTSGYGTPIENIAKRDKYHHKNKDGFQSAELDESSTNSAAIRGREQDMIEVNGGAKSTGGTSGNAINGVGDKNPNKAYYKRESQKEFGDISSKESSKTEVDTNSKSNRGGSQKESSDSKSSQSSSDNSKR